MGSILRMWLDCLREQLSHRLKVGDITQLYIMRFDSMIWFGLIWLDLIWFDLIWFDLIWFDLIWFGLVTVSLMLFDCLMSYYGYSHLYSVAWYHLPRKKVEKGHDESSYLSILFIFNKIKIAISLQRNIHRRNGRHFNPWRSVYEERRHGLPIDKRTSPSTELFRWVV